MNIKINTEERVRVNDNISNNPFIDLKQESNELHTTLTASFYEMHQIFIVKLNRTFKLFLFDKKALVSMDDFGYYKEGDIVFTNSSIKRW